MSQEETGALAGQEQRSSYICHLFCSEEYNHAEGISVAPLSNASTSDSVDRAELASALWVRYKSIAEQASPALSSSRDLMRQSMCVCVCVSVCLFLRVPFSPCLEGRPEGRPLSGVLDARSVRVADLSDHALRSWDVSFRPNLSTNCRKSDTHTHTFFVGRDGRPGALLFFGAALRRSCVRGHKCVQSGQRGGKSRLEEFTA